MAPERDPLPLSPMSADTSTFSVRAVELAHLMARSKALEYRAAPNSLPHDPPHPRVSPLAPGYSPRFSKGLLLPLEGTLAHQLHAIARSYGLPSTAGIVCYLTEHLGAPLNGPRLTDETWSLLWNPADEDAADETGSVYSEDEDSQVPPVPMIPVQHRQEDSQDGGPLTPVGQSGDESTLSAPSPLRDTQRSARTGRASQPTLAKSAAWSVPPRPRSVASLASPNSAARRSLSAYSLRGPSSKARGPVIVGTIEWEIDARAKWYAGWLAGANGEGARTDGPGARELMLPAMLTARMDGTDSRETSVAAPSSGTPAEPSSQPSRPSSSDEPTGLGISDVEVGALASPLQTITSPEVVEPRPESEVLDLDQLDDLERALADLSPRAARAMSPRSVNSIRSPRLLGESLSHLRAQ